METVFGVRDKAGKYFYGIFLSHQRELAEMIAARNNLIVVELAERCPAKWAGDDMTAYDCIGNGHCGCDAALAPNAADKGRA